jgi:adenylate kinase
VRVAVTGTPGTGKTTVTELLDTDIDVAHLNDLVASEGLYSEVDDARGSRVVDIEAVREYFDGRDDVLVESHLAHHIDDLDRVVVLRCEPGELDDRLQDRGEPPEKAGENAESEALDVILSEAVRDHGQEHVYEIDTTGRDPEAVAGDVQAVLDGDREPSAGDVNFTDYL